MNHYKTVVKLELSNRLSNKLSVKPPTFFNLVNSGLSSGLVAQKTGVSTRTVQRLRRQLVEDLSKTTDFTSWDVSTKNFT